MDNLSHTVGFGRTPAAFLFALFSMLAFASCANEDSRRPLDMGDCEDAEDGCPPLSCEGAGDCYAGYVCESGQCIVDEDTGDGACDCDDGFICEGDTCVPEDDSCDCDDGFICEDDTCVPEDDSCDCDDGFMCEDDTCVPEDDSCDCDDGFMCEDDTCVPEDSACDDLNDCSDDQICQEDVCIPIDPNASSAAEILSFSLRHLPAASPGENDPILLGTIDDENMIGIYGDGFDISNTRPTIEISEGASISPAVSVPQDFTQPVEYTVTAEDGTTRVYTVDDINQLHNFEIKNGFNIGSWLYNPKPDAEDRADFFNKNDIQYLQELGFDHIRINIDEDILWDDDGNKIREHGWDLLHDAIKWSQRLGMRVLVDLHTTRNHRFTVTNNALFEGGQAELDYFIDLWMQFSEELSDYSNAMVAYELLNEPIAVEPLDWNGVADATIAAIRAVEPDRTIVVGVAASRGQAASYDKLQITSRHNILTTFHFYSPSVFTLFRMPGTVAADNPDIDSDFPISYPGQLVPDTHLWVFPEGWIREKFRRTITKEWLADGIQDGLDMADRLNLPVFVGEFGVLNTIEQESRVRWTEDVVDILKEAGDIPYTYFDFKGYGFSLFNDDGTIKYQDLIDVIR